ncbi:hypothetical protein ACK3TF_001514 [Chlorella vulgaris]
MASLATAAGSLHAAVRCQQAPCKAGVRAVAVVAPRPAAAWPQQSRGLTSSRTRSLVVASAVQAESPAGEGKLISKVEIPAFIPRSDLIDQLLRWSMIEIQENGVANCGTPAKVTVYKRDDSIWGFTVSFLKDGVSATDVRVAFDEETVQKHDWIGRGSDGMPVLEGNAENIQGKHLEIRKVCDNVVSENMRSSIREFCTLLVAAINKYYAFGSCFVDDAT